LPPTDTALDLLQGRDGGGDVGDLPKLIEKDKKKKKEEGKKSGPSNRKEGESHSLAAQLMAGAAKKLPCDRFEEWWDKRDRRRNSWEGWKIAISAGICACEKRKKDYLRGRKVSRGLLPNKGEKGGPQRPGTKAKGGEEDGVREWSST